jgi:hypothetical protein
MPFSQLLSKLLDNVNLGKMLVDGGPGVLLALAVLLMVCQVIPQDSDRRIPTPFLKLVVKADIEKTREEIETVEAQSANLAGTIAGEDQKLQNLSKLITRAETLAEEGRTHITRSGGGESRQIKVEELYQNAADLRQHKAKDEKSAEFTAKHLDELRAKLEKRRQEFVRDGRVLLSEVINLLLALSILGYVLGTLFSGLNRGLWLLRLPQLWHLTVGRIFTWFQLNQVKSPEARARIVLKRKMQSEELRLGTAVILEDHIKEPLLRKLQEDFAVPTMHQEGAEGSKAGSWSFERGTLSQLEQRFEEDNPKTLPAMYYIGRGIISQQEYDGLVTGYYRWAEATANLIPPILVLGLALSMIDPWLRHPLILSWVLALILYAAAQNSYGEYKRRVRSFIKGRLDQERKRRDDAANQKSATGGGGGTPRPGRQRLEIIADGEKAAEILKRIEEMMQRGPSPMSSETDS